MLCKSAIFELPNTDLGIAFEAHVARHPHGPYALGGYDTAWLNVLRDRTARTNDATLKKFTDDMLELFANPTAAGVAFRDRFRDLHENAGNHAYPLTWLLRGEASKLSGVAGDFTLNCIDLGLLRRIEDAALDDPDVAEFIKQMLNLLGDLKKKPHHEVMPKVFEIYSEAVVYLLIKERGRLRGLRIRKIKETAVPGPDFECVLPVGICKPRELTFYLELKSLDVADAQQRLPEMTDDSLNANVDLERQIRDGKKLAIVATEIAPAKRYKSGSRYDSRSVKNLIELLISKASNNFSSQQFQRGPTFAVIGLLRFPLPGQGQNGLAPFYYDPYEGGACISGILWNLAFGTTGTPIHRSPEFTGKGTLEGQLDRDGLLVDPAKNLPAAGMISLEHDDGNYRLYGLFDRTWQDQAHNWSDSETDEVLHVLCDGYNDRVNGMAHEYSFRQAEDLSILDHLRGLYRLLVNGVAQLVGQLKGYAARLRDRIQRLAARYRP